MKSIGPYVISAIPAPAAAYDSSGMAAGKGGAPGDRAADRAGQPAPDTGPASPGRALTLHGVDRLTGMPVLLHRLNEFVVPAPLPESASLLPVYEVDVWDGQPYAVTELPLSATPATHPGAAALGALRALSALHAAGQVHGNVNASQLWQVGREVRLAGAGLPWSREGSPAADLAALGQALDSLGARPAALDGLETQSAAQALSTLEKALQGQRPAGAGTAQPHRPAALARPVQAAPQPVVAPEIAQTSEPPVQPAANPPAPVAEPTSSAVPEPVGPAQPQARPDRSQAKSQTSRKAARKQEQAARKAVPVAESESTDAAVRDNSVLVVRPIPAPEVPPVSPAEEPSAPVSYRSAGDIIVIGEPQTPGLETADEQETAAGPSSSAAEPQPPASPPVRLIPAPIRIGFDDVPPLLPDWKPQGPQAQAEPQPETEVSAPPVTPLPTSPAFEERGEHVTDPTPPAVNSVRTQPLRIGWEEDHSWRVVKSGPEPRRLQAPVLSGRSLPRSVMMVLAAVLVLGGAAFWWRGQAATPADACCAQRFTVSGSRQTVKVTLVKAPPGSPLTPGGVVGTVPGTLKFPDAPGNYTLKFEAAGHRALSGVVTVPSDQAFDIVLK